MYSLIPPFNLASVRHNSKEEGTARIAAIWVHAGGHLHPMLSYLSKQVGNAGKVKLLWNPMQCWMSGSYNEGVQEGAATPCSLGAGWALLETWPPISLYVPHLQSWRSFLPFTLSLSLSRWESSWGRDCISLGAQVRWGPAVAKVIITTGRRMMMHLSWLQDIAGTFRSYHRN